MRLSNITRTLCYILVVHLCSCVTAKRPDEGRVKTRRLERYNNSPNDVPFDLSTEICHKIALRRCGHNFMKIFNLVDYLTGIDHYNAQCTLRKAFFKCIEKMQTRTVCRRKRINLAPIDERRFRKRLADAVWKTRICIMGIQDVKELPGKIINTG